jgi:hypothetical protein
MGLTPEGRHWQAHCSSGAGRRPLRCRHWRRALAGALPLSLASSKQGFKLKAPHGTTHLQPVETPSRHQAAAAASKVCAGAA